MSQRSLSLARVALPLPLEGFFVYGVPPDLHGQLRPGCQVSVPFRSRSLRGFVIEVFEGEPPRGLRDIKALVGGPLGEPVMRLTRWVSSYYMAPWGEVLKAAVPKPVGRLRIPAVTAGRPTVPEHGPALEPSSHQRAILEALSTRLAGSGFEVCLLQGVTGSGKTFVYCRAAAEVVRGGGACLVLVPEISLSTQLVERFREFFGDAVVVTHSGLSPSERYITWVKAGAGEAKVVVGARSAVFSPLKDLRLIIVDEEHEPSYKQNDVPRYNARDVAVKRGQLEGCVVMLGSATPSLESYNNALSGKYAMLHLPCRVDSRPMASVEVVDMREEREKRGEDSAAAGSRFFSGVLRDRIEDRLEKGEQVILFINRRGHSTFVQCRDCGTSFRCPKCEVALTYHSDPHRLTCHYCGYSSKGTKTCPKCAGSNFWFGGVGTQKVEDEIKEMFPGVRVLRMDIDSTRRRGSQRSMVETFSSGEASILLGTQMVAKGLDFPGVTLVGVVHADTQLNLPDFRASERTFQLLTQVAGRAGRGGTPGEVVVQTFLPDHPSVRAAALQDFELFYGREIQDRKELGFPPFSRLVDVSFTGRDEGEVIRCSTLVKEKMDKWLRSGKISGVDVMGPAPYPISRIRNRTRWHVTLRGDSLRELRRSIEALKAISEAERPAKLAVGMDVDPLQLM